KTHHHASAPILYPYTTLFRSLNNKTFTEEQHKQLRVTTVGKLIFNEILPDSFPYINEPTQSNLEIETPEKYFLASAIDVKDEIRSEEHTSELQSRFDLVCSHR